MLLVEFEPVIDQLVNARAIGLAARLHSLQLRGVRDIAPGYCTIGVHFDPLQTDLVALERAISNESGATDSVGEAAAKAPVEIGVRYGGADGPDLEAVAAHAGCTPAEVVERHAARVYRVYMLGFVPGFAYMGRVDSTIAMARHRVPRERVPSGSVGIAGQQTGVYPVASPGGWQLIGRTESVLFDAARNPASLLAAGDLVRFVPLAGAGQ